jgi:hypothetical protein
MKNWDPDEARKALLEETDVMDGGDLLATSRRLVRDALPSLTQGVIHLALWGETEKMRFDASRYLMDRALGSVQPGGDASDEKDSLEKLVESLTGITYSEN